MGRNRRRKSELGPPPDGLLKALAARALNPAEAKADRRAASQKLLRWYVDSVDLGEQVPAAVADYLRDALRLVLDGKAESADDALGLLRAPHREGGHREEQHLRIAIEYVRACRVHQKREAKTRVAEMFGCEPRTVERAVAENKYLIELLSDAEIDALSSE